MNIDRTQLDAGSSGMVLGRPSVPISILTHSAHLIRHEMGRMTPPPSVK